MGMQGLFQLWCLQRFSNPTSLFSVALRHLEMQPPSWKGNYIDDWKELRREENEKQTFLT